MSAQDLIKLVIWAVQIVASADHRKIGMELERDLPQGRPVSWNLYQCQNPRSNPSQASPSERV